MEVKFHLNIISQSVELVCLGLEKLRAWWWSEVKTDSPGFIRWKCLNNLIDYKFIAKFYWTLNIESYVVLDTVYSEGSHL